MENEQPMMAQTPAPMRQVGPEEKETHSIKAPIIIFIAIVAIIVVIGIIIWVFSEIGEMAEQNSANVMLENVSTEGQDAYYALCNKYNKKFNVDTDEITEDRITLTDNDGEIFVLARSEDGIWADNYEIKVAVAQFMNYVKDISDDKVHVGLMSCNLFMAVDEPALENDDQIFDKYSKEIGGPVNVRLLYFDDNIDITSAIKKVAENGPIHSCIYTVEHRPNYYSDNPLATFQCDKRFYYIYVDGEFKESTVYPG